MALPQTTAAVGRKPFRILDLPGELQLRIWETFFESLEIDTFVRDERVRPALVPGFDYSDRTPDQLSIFNTSLRFLEYFKKAAYKHATFSIPRWAMDNAWPYDEWAHPGWWDLLPNGRLARVHKLRGCGDLVQIFKSTNDLSGMIEKHFPSLSSIELDVINERNTGLHNLGALLSPDSKYCTCVTLFKRSRAAGPDIPQMVVHSNKGLILTTEQRAILSESELTQIVSYASRYDLLNKIVVQDSHA